MKYTITENKQYNGIEIAFDGKPSEAVREALKAARFRWHNVKKVWYGYGTEEAARAILDGSKPETEAEKPGTVTEKAAKLDKAALRSEFAKAWESDKMVDYCTDKVAAVAVLPSGEIVTVDKQHIETRFCFGEDGYDYDEAAAGVRTAYTSESYFKSENMKAFRDALSDINEAKNPEAGRWFLIIGGAHYRGQSEDCRLRWIGYKRVSEVLEDLGGSARLSELPGKRIEPKDGNPAYRIATPEEIDAIEAAYKAAASAHEKKVDSYLKRYGLSKVHAWTYWRNA